MISKDTLSANNYNQIAGKQLIGLFNDNNKLHYVNIIKNAEVIYYFRNDKDELVGIDKSKSGRIEIFLSENTIDEVRKINSIDGNIHPESQFPNNANRLRGFDWRGDERPKSIEDLFSEDPPLILPKIRGIDDDEYSDDFFDKELLERIEKADKESEKLQKNKPKRASRHIPKGVIKKKDSINKTKLPKPLMKKEN